MSNWRLSVMALIILLLVGCGDASKSMESNFKIKISGTEGMKYSGYYTFVKTGTVPKPENAEGSLPAEYKNNGIAAVCVIRKKTAEGTLKVEILKDDKVVSASETSTPYGVISLGKIPDKDSILGKILGKILG